MNDSDTTLDLNIRDIANAAAEANHPRPVKTLEPLNDTVVYKLEEPPPTPAGLIVTTVEDKARLIVVAVGPGKLGPDGERDVPFFGPGDEIVRWPGGKLIRSDHYGPEPVYLCRIDDVAAVVHTATASLILVP